MHQSKLLKQISKLTNENFKMAQNTQQNDVVNLSETIYKANYIINLCLGQIFNEFFNSSKKGLVEIIQKNFNILNIYIKKALQFSYQVIENQRVKNQMNFQLSQKMSLDKGEDFQQIFKSLKQVELTQERQIEQFLTDEQIEIKAQKYFRDFQAKQQLNEISSPLILLRLNDIIIESMIQSEEDKQQILSKQLKYLSYLNISESNETFDLLTKMRERLEEEIQILNPILCTKCESLMTPQFENLKIDITNKVQKLENFFGLVQNTLKQPQIQKFDVHCQTVEQLIDPKLVIALEYKIKELQTEKSNFQEEFHKIEKEKSHFKLKITDQENQIDKLTLDVDQLSEENQQQKINIENLLKQAQINKQQNQEIEKVNILYRNSFKSGKDFLKKLQKQLQQIFKEDHIPVDNLFVDKNKELNEFKNIFANLEQYTLQINKKFENLNSLFDEDVQHSKKMPKLFIQWNSIIEKSQQKLISSRDLSKDNSIVLQNKSCTKYEEMEYIKDQSILKKQKQKTSKDISQQQLIIQKKNQTKDENKKDQRKINQKQNQNTSKINPQLKIKSISKEQIANKNSTQDNTIVKQIPITKGIFHFQIFFYLQQKQILENSQNDQRNRPYYMKQIQDPNQIIEKKLKILIDKQPSNLQELKMKYYEMILMKKGKLNIKEYFRPIGYSQKLNQKQSNISIQKSTHHQQINFRKNYSLHLPQEEFREIRSKLLPKDLKDLEIVFFQIHLKVSEQTKQQKLSFDEIEKMRIQLQNDLNVTKSFNIRQKINFLIDKYLILHKQAPEFFLIKKFKNKMEQFIKISLKREQLNLPIVNVDEVNFLQKIQQSINEQLSNFTHIPIPSISFLFSFFFQLSKNTLLFPLITLPQPINKQNQNDTTNYGQKFCCFI